MGTYLDDVGFALTLTNLKPKFDALAEQIGDLDQLDTTAKTDLVAAINEVKSGGGIKRFTGTDLNDLKTPGVYISDEQKLHLPSENIGDWIIIVTGTMAKTQYALPPDDASLYCRTMTFWSAVWTEWKTFAKTEDVTGITGELSGLTTSAKTNLVAAVNEVLATANKKLDLIQLEPTSTSATVDIPTGGCVLVVTANHTVTLTFNGNAGDLVILVNNTTGNIRNFALSPVLPSNNIAVILMDGEHAGQSLFRTDVIPDSVAEVTGDLENLTTTAKDSLVAAINEIASSSGGSGEFPEVTNPDNATTTGIYIYVIGVQRGLLLVSASTTSLKQQIMIFSSGAFQRRVFSGSPSTGYIWGDWEDIVTNSTVGDLDNLTTTAKNNLVSAINEVANGSGGQITVQGTINEVNATAIITKTREGATSTDMGLISNLPIYTTDGGQIEYSGVFGDDKEVIPLINLILKWGTKTYKTTLFQSRYQPSSDTNGYIHQMLYWNNGEIGIVAITRSIEISNQNETYWGVWTDCNGKEYSDLA